MRKIIAGIFLLLGAGVIATGVFLQFDQEKSKDKEKPETEEKKNQKFEIVNTYNLKDTCTTYSKVPAYLYFTDLTKVSFTYPDCVHEYDNNYWMKQLKNDFSHEDINITITREKEEPENLLKRKKTSAIGYKNEGLYDALEYSKISEVTLDNGLKAYAFQYNYRNDLVTTTTHYSQWYIALRINENNTLMIDVHTDKSIITQKAILDILNSIKIEKVESIKTSKIEGEYQVGSIKQNSYKKYDHGYIMTYRVNKKYPEVDSVSTNINAAVFQYEDINKEIYVSYELETDYQTTLENATSYRKVSIPKEDEHKRNIKTTALIQKEIKDKKIIYFINSYDYYNDNKKTSTYYTSYVYYEVEPNFFLKIYISNKNHEVNEAFISEFLDFTLEEY